MNIAKTILASFALLGAALPAFAEPSTDATIVRLTGSSAFRAATHAAIVALYDALPVAGYSGSNLSGSNQSFFYGQVSGQPVIFSTSWSGSTGGIQVVAGGLPVNFLADTLADTGSTLAAATLSSGTAGGGSSLAAGTNSKVADIAMGDSYQSATPFKAGAVVNSVTYSGLADAVVGVIGFKWVASRGTNVVTLSATSTAASPILTLADTTGLTAGMTVSSTNLPTTLLKILSVDSSTQVTLTSGTGVLAGTSVSTTFVTPCPITNISTQSAQALYSNGTAKLSLFTGSPADNGVTVYAGGRDPDSGTRLTAFAETGIGVDSAVTQYKPTVTGSTLTAIAPYPAITINGIFFDVGNSGESSGSTLRNYFSKTTSAIGGHLVGYLGTGDSPTAINGGARELTYNGVTYSDAAVKEGLYTFWCYEHVLYPTALNSAAVGSVGNKKKVLADSLANLIKTTYAPIKISEMNCSRSSDGGVVFHN